MGESLSWQVMDEVPVFLISPAHAPVCGTATRVSAPVEAFQPVSAVSKPALPARLVPPPPPAGFTVTVTSSVVVSAPSLPESRSPYAPVVLNVAVVWADDAFAKVTVPGPAEPWTR